LDDALRGKVSGVKPSDVLLQAALATLRTAAIDTASRYQFFFACFSEHQDQLSQWRAYSGNASGFSIGFTEDVLRNQAFLEELRRDKLGDTLDLLKVIYDEPTQTAILDELVSSARRHADDVMPTLPLEQRKNYIVDANVWFISSILRLALHFKHPGFQEEAEWRLILCKTSPDKAESETSNPVRTRLTGFGTTPYVTMPLCAHDEQLRLEHVIVGPKSQPIMFEGKSSYGLKILLRQLHGGGPARGISNSEIPYR
jgi:hypothetical protein